jgi:glycine/D-amino acid oxidase-like deaminating enzyme/nitrite reductase/ring-hydroxylating ferredoxin subunit
MDTPATRSPWMSVTAPHFPPLDGNARVDVCVVGAGIAGMTAAYLLTKKGRRVMVLDDGPIGGGMTVRTTAHLTNAIDDRYYEVEKMHGEEGARLACQSHFAAIEAIEAICENEGIECDFRRVDGYLFNPPDGAPDELVREYGAALRAGVEGLVWVDRAPIEAFDTGRCLKFPRQGQFHPMKYLSGLARAILREGGVIHCDTHAQQICDGEEPYVITSNGHRIDCQDIVVATNTPVNDRVAIHTKQAPYITYVIAVRVPRGTVDTALFWDTLDAYHYVRLMEPDGEVLIVGGEDHKTGQADDHERRWADLELWTRERFPMAREVLHRWMGQVMETYDYLAFAGRNPGEKHVYVHTGDSGMGMTHGTIGAIVITDLIHGVEVPWARLYDPGRITLKAAREFTKENSNVAWQYTDWVKPGEVRSVDEISAGSGAVLRRGVHMIAVHRDEGGTLHEMSAKCTHLGCVVHWNGADQTWDCKCHGSRFDAHGHVMNGPANVDLRPVEDSPDVPVRNTRQPGEQPPTPPI